MTYLSPNPMGLNGFEFVEFSSPKPGILEPIFRALGFTEIAVHRSKDVSLFRQGQINFIVNREPQSLAAYFAKEHGPSACGLAFRVRDGQAAYNHALELGAQPIDLATGPMELRLPAIKSIGGAPIYLIGQFNEGTSIYDIDFQFIESIDREPYGCGLQEIDHLTYNVYRGRTDYWANYYEKIFNFGEFRYCDIRGGHIRLISKTMAAPDGKIHILLEEEVSGSFGQIEEFLMQYNGEGIQHIALACDDLLETWDRLKANRIPFMSPPPRAYYEMLEERLPGHGEPIEELAIRGILLDGSTTENSPRLLLQIFSETLLGPLSFEFVQRKHDEGFGEGNFRALFESIDRDQNRQSDGIDRG